MLINTLFINFMIMIILILFHRYPSKTDVKHISINLPANCFKTFFLNTLIVYVKRRWCISLNEKIHNMHMFRNIHYSQASESVNIILNIF